MKKILMSLITIALVGGLITGGVMAYFSDTATSTDNTFQAGTLSINDGMVSQTAAIIIPNMAPGDVTGEFVITIVNNGTIDLAWFGDWQFTGGGGSPDLMNALYIDYAKMEFLSPLGADWLDDTTSGYEGDGSDLFIENGIGHGPYPSWYNTLAAASTFGVLSFNEWNDNAGMVPGSVYEHAGALRPGYKYRLTVKFGFAPLAGNGYQNLGPVTAQLRVDATQINSAALQILGVPAGTADAWTLPNGWINNQIADQTE